jgi:transcriptional regulator with XRE-family HTH domain
MKISDKDKGLMPIPCQETDEEHLQALIERDSKLTEADYAAMYAQELETMQILEENDRIKKSWEANGPVNFHQLRQLQKDGQVSGTNYIGERVVYLRKLIGLQPVDIYTSAGIAKTTLYRIEEGKNIPTEKVITNILYSLQTSLADFSCFPGDFEQWKATITNTGSSTNIYKFRDHVLAELDSYNFSYNLAGKSVQLPRAHLLFLKRLLLDSFAILDLLPHDHNQ